MENIFDIGKILVMDGSMMTMILKYDTGEDNLEALNLGRPDIVREIHDEFTDAGADIIRANTLNANRLSQKAFGCSETAREMAFHGARIARGAADWGAAKDHRRILVAGSMGPTQESPALFGDRTPKKEIYQAFREQAEALIEGGADFIMLENFFDAETAVMALKAVRDIRPEFPAIITITLGIHDGKTLAELTAEEFHDAVLPYNPAAFGIGSGICVHDSVQFVKKLASFSKVPVICCPDAGLPDDFGRFNERPERMAYMACKMGKYLNVIGGCYGTLPEHVCALKTAVTDMTPRRICVMEEEGPAQMKETASERIVMALVNGTREGFEDDIRQCLAEEGAAEKVLDGPLMTGMERVEALLGDGTITIKKALEAAEMLQQAMGILGEHLKENMKKVRFATAAVCPGPPDIEKSITGIILECNGFEVRDFGTVTDESRILEETRNAEVMSLTAGTPMGPGKLAAICRLLEEAGSDTILLVSGAYTSARHTATVLAPLYSHVYYCHKDLVDKLKRIADDRESFEVEEQGMIRAILESANGAGKVVRQSGKGEGAFSRKSFVLESEMDFRSPAAENISIADLVRMMDWNIFLEACGIEAPSCNSKSTPETAALRKTGRTVLRAMLRSKRIGAGYSVRFFGAWSKENTIFMEAKDGTAASLPMLRQETVGKRSDGKVCCMSICDWLPDASYEMRSPFGVYSETIDYIADFKSDERTAMIEHALVEALRDALSKLVTTTIRKCVKGQQRIISKIAAGSPECPDVSLTADISALLSSDEDTVQEDSSGNPGSLSEYGFVIVHPTSVSFDIGTIGRAQYNSYAARRGFSEEEASRYLGELLGR